MATPEELTEDPEAFDCESCPYRQVDDALSEADRLALHAYRLLARPVVRDLGLVPLVFDLLQWQGTTEDAVQFLTRLDRIHTELTQAARAAQADGARRRDGALDG